VGRQSFITTDSALIDYNPILSGQISPYKVMRRINPMMEHYTIEFKENLGTAIESVDLRKEH